MRCAPSLIVVFAASLASLADLAPAPATAAAAEQQNNGRVTEVTLYREQALVTRTIEVKGAKGSMELVVGDLPENVVSGSLFAEGGENVEVRAVRFRSRAVGEEPREEVRKLDEAIIELNEQIELARKTQELLAKRSQYLDQLESFVASTAKTDLAKGVLDAVALEKVSTFSFAQRQEVLTGQLDLNKKTRELTEELTLQQRRRAELTDGSSRTIRETVVFLEKKADGNETVRLNYLVANCGWSPTYTFRADGEAEQVRGEYNALIRQMSGEDWPGVVLTLSTASPALSAAGPGLAPFHVTLSGPENKQNQKKEQLAKQLKDIRGRQSSAIMQNRSTFGLRGNIDASWQANSAANDLQGLELINPKDAFQQLPKTGSLVDGPSLSYQLSGTVSLASRSDQQMIRILQTAFKSQFYQVATPVLSSYVYREAELTNDSDHDLLGGPITVYLDGRFVGRSEIPTVARGQRFVVGFGADPQLRASRELADRREDVQGGNKELDFEYRLVIENYRDAEVLVRVLDRLPYSNRQADIRVTLGQMDDQLSEDKLYLRTERPKGLLRWEIKVPAGATGENARIVKYSYKVEFDRNLAITTLGDGNENLQEEFEELQQFRYSR